MMDSLSNFFAKILQYYISQEHHEEKWVCVNKLSDLKTFEISLLTSCQLYQINVG